MILKLKQLLYIKSLADIVFRTIPPSLERMKVVMWLLWFVLIIRLTKSQTGNYLIRCWLSWILPVSHSSRGQSGRTSRSVPTDDPHSTTVRRGVVLREVDWHPPRRGDSRLGLLALRSLAGVNFGELGGKRTSPNERRRFWPCDRRNTFELYSDLERVFVWEYLFTFWQ